MARRFSSLMNDAPREEAVSPGYSKNVKFFQFLIHEYRNIGFVLEVLESIIVFLSRFWLKNKKYQRVINLLKYGVPAGVFISDFLNKIKAYRMIKSGKNSVSNESIDKYKELFDITKDNVRVDNYPFMLGSEVTRWMLQRPKTESFKILGYHQWDNLQNITDTYKEDDSTLITAIEMGEAKFAWMTRMFCSTEDDLYLRFSDIYTTMEHISKINDLKGKIFREFIQHFDTTNNVLLLSSGGLSTYPRQDVVEKPEQFNIQQFSSEIRKILQRGKKRGFVFVGVPGTGKSTIIHCLEAIITEYPIVYVSSNCFISPSVVKETFNTLRYIQPCVVIIEDLDSCELKDKKQALGEFLEQIDDVDSTLNIALLTTVNDTSLVHYSLINRPGRFDEVIKIETPHSAGEIYNIMQCRFRKNKARESNVEIPKFISFEKINKDYLNEILSKKYTQADVCEVIEKSLLISDDFTNETFRESLESLERSKKALRECDFGGNDPFKNDDMEDCMKTEECGTGYGSSAFYPAKKRERA